jgi:small subunit ribosomal protein S15
VPLTTGKKKEILAGYRQHDQDTGSAGVQIAMLTQRINDLAPHLERAVKDNHSRRGLMKMVGKRKRLLAYLKREKPESYKQLIEKLDLRK